MCIWGTKSAQFQSLSCQKFIHIYDFGGDKGEAPPCLRKFVFGGLNLHNFRPFFNLTFYKDIGFLGAEGYSGPSTQNIKGLSPPRPRFLSLCNFIMLVWVQGSVFQIAAGSHPVQEIWGSHDSLYRDLIQKLLRCCREPYQQIPLVITIQKKYSLTYLRP